MTQVTVDIEAMTADGLHSWQKDLINHSIGFKTGEMMVISAGRQTGKSYYNQFMQNYMSEMNAPAYKQMDKATVDNEEWVTVKCNYETAAWVREQKQKYWYEHNTLTIGSMFDIHEKLYTMLKIKFTP